MKIHLITPVGPQSLSGNGATAARWAGFLRQSGHRVEVATDYAGESADLMLALHAWRSAAAIEAFRARFPARPLIVALTGTDIYSFQHSDPDVTHASMARADVLIGLHDRVARDIPAAYRDKLRVIFQSARPLPQPPAPGARHFTVCVIGHLRPEKDPLRAALAAREMPANSRLRVIQVGRAHDPDWAARAREEGLSNGRYQWRGEIARGDVRRLMARAHLMVMSSIMEGGANVISEACVAGLPVIASAIPGNIGLLGESYPGYYPAEDTRALAVLLRRAEQDPAFLDTLRGHCRERARLFRPEAEHASLDTIIGELAPVRQP